MMLNELIKNIPIEKEFKSFEGELSRLIDENDCFLKNDLKEFIFSNPKRLRPFLVFIFAKILEIENPIVQNIALSIELIHCASLIHDDIIDNQNFRRKKPALYKTFGYKKATLSGDLLLSIALKELAKTNIEIVKIVSCKIQKTILGELKQNEKSYNIISIENYYKKTFNKTGNLFMAGLEALFTLKEINNDTKKNLRDFVYNFSLAFQIKNDIDDIEKDMSDIKNGNYTLAVIYFFMENKDFNPLELKKDNLKTSILKANQKVEEFKIEAIKNLEKIDSKYKNSLIDLCNILF